MLYFRFALVLLLPLIASCGFSPLYGQQDQQNFGSKLAAIDIAVNSPELANQIANQLSDNLNPHNIEISKQYKLTIDIKMVSEPLAIQTNSDIIIYNAKILGNYSLLELATGKQLDNGIINISNSYAAVPSVFATHIAAKDAYESAIQGMVDDITKQMLIMVSSK